VYCVSFIVMLNVIMLIVIMLSVIMLIVIMLIVIMLIVIMVIVIMVIVIMLSVIMLIVIMLIVIMLIVVRPFITLPLLCVSTPNKSQYNATLKCSLVINSMEQCALKDVNNCLNTNTYFYLEKSGGQSSNLYINVAHFFNASVN
jgi:hypothetical protein